MLHYLLPSFIIALIIIHLGTLHKLGSTNSYQSSIIIDLQYFNIYSYFIVKNIFVLVLFLIIASYLIFYFPTIFDNPVNNIGSNSLLTPKHIVPK